MAALVRSLYGLQSPEDGARIISLVSANGTAFGATRSIEVEAGGNAVLPTHEPQRYVKPPTAEVSANNATSTQRDRRGGLPTRPSKAFGCARTRPHGDAAPVRSDYSSHEL
jgi:hypothetical protein